MDRGKRQPVMAGNWKMNFNRKETMSFFKEFAQKVGTPQCKVILCVPYTNLGTAVEYVSQENIPAFVGAQNCHWAESGAFTGEIAPQMLTDLGVSYVILGHSERRQYFGETNETVAQRVRAALDAGVSPIVCVGEQLSEREQGITKELCALQVKIALSKVASEEMSKVILAYEPVWAIGTGKTATAQQANEVCGWLRDTLEELYGKDIAEQTAILYGGSMNTKNAQELLAQPHVDGGLIGGASLKTDDFAQLVAFASQE